MFLIIFITTIVISIATFIILRQFIWRRKKGRDGKVRAMIVIGSGGHTSEMMRLMDNVRHETLFSHLTFVIADNDGMSEEKVRDKYGDCDDCEIVLIKRSREVGQSYMSSIISTLVSLMQSCLIIFHSQPQLVLCNGPGTCIPICVAAKLISSHVMVIFVESFCRTQSLSLSGKILYHLGLYDVLLVQWPQLQMKYSKTSYIGLLV